MKIPSLLVFATNKKANKDYQILGGCTGGLILLGWEVKQIIKKEVDLLGSHVSINHKTNEVTLEGCYIKPITSNFADITPTRSRKILLNKSEIRSLIEHQKKNLRIIPLELKYVNKKIKLEIAVCSKIKKGDKRQVEKEKESKKEIVNYENGN